MINLGIHVSSFRRIFVKAWFVVINLITFKPRVQNWNLNMPVLVTFSFFLYIFKIVILEKNYTKTSWTSKTEFMLISISKKLKIITVSILKSKIEQTWAILWLTVFKLKVVPIAELCNTVSSSWFWSSFARNRTSCPIRPERPATYRPEIRQTN